VTFCPSQQRRSTISVSVFWDVATVVTHSTWSPGPSDSLFTYVNIQQEKNLRLEWATKQRKATFSKFLTNVCAAFAGKLLLPFLGESFSLQSHGLVTWSSLLIVQVVFTMTNMTEM
jgi:hypothetical protein